MFKTILTAAGLFRSTTYIKPTQVSVRRARWRGSDGQWQWAGV
jgi:hypothetical protein